MSQGLSLCLIGDSGSGKSHLLIALGTEAAMAGHPSILCTQPDTIRTFRP